MTTSAEAMRTTDDGTLVTHPPEGPCTEDEANKLVETAIRASDTFYDTMAEIIRRKAWEPLGHSSLQSLLAGPLSATAVNQSTGKSYTRAHTYRLARMSMLLFSISEKTGVAPGDIALTERTLRNLPAGVSGDSDLVDAISAQIDAAGLDDNASPDDVNAIVNSVVSDAADGKDDDDEFDDDGPAASASSESMSSIQGEQQGGSGGRETSGGSVASSDAEDGSGDAEPAREAGSPAFDAYNADGWDDEPEPPATDFSDALSRVRQRSEFSENLDTIIEVASTLPEVAKIEGELPEFLDVIDDDELAEFKSKLDSSRKALDKIAAAQQAIDRTAEETDIRIDEA